MVIFTYNDYLDYISSSKIKKVINNQNKIRSIKKQKTKEIKYKKSEILKLINMFLDKENLNMKEEQIELYNKYSKENEIFKVKNKQIYILIKIQEKPDYNISYTILTECMNFVEEWKLENKKHKKTPIIIPIIIYIGKEKWNINTTTKIKYTSFEENRTNLAYNIIDLNKKSPKMKEYKRFLNQESIK